MHNFVKDLSSNMLLVFLLGKTITSFKFSFLHLTAIPKVSSVHTLDCSDCVSLASVYWYLSIKLSYVESVCLKFLLDQNRSAGKAAELLDSLIWLLTFYNFALFLLPTAVGFYCKYLGILLSFVYSLLFSKRSFDRELSEVGSIVLFPLVK